MKETIPFAFEGHAIRVVHDDHNTPWFVGKDVCTVLGYSNHADAITKHCKGVAKRYPLQTDGGLQEVRIINEPDLYRLVIGSKLPAAERFERWIFEEVLPAIRQTGSYHHPSPTGPSEHALAIGRRYRALADTLGVDIATLHPEAFAEIERATGIQIALPAPAPSPDSALTAFWRDVQALLGQQPSLNLSQAPNTLELMASRLLYALRDAGHDWPMPQIHWLLKASTAPHPTFLGKKTKRLSATRSAVVWCFSITNQPARSI